MPQLCTSTEVGHPKEKVKNKNPIYHHTTQSPKPKAKRKKEAKEKFI